MADWKLSEDEARNIKDDLLSFIHSVASGEFNKPEHIAVFIPAVKILAEYFSG